MSKPFIRFSPRAQQSTLGQFPESGTLMPEYGNDIRRVIYQKYSFLYRQKGNVIEILTVYRENLP
jgi:plasmid stabilization system protein ParE